MWMLLARKEKETTNVVRTAADNALRENAHKARRCEAGRRLGNGIGPQQFERYYWKCGKYEREGTDCRASKGEENGRKGKRPT